MLAAHWRAHRLPLPAATDKEASRKGPLGKGPLAEMEAGRRAKEIEQSQSTKKRGRQNELKECCPVCTSESVFFGGGGMLAFQSS